jgi:hypothetical protein
LTGEVVQVGNLLLHITAYVFESCRVRGETGQTLYARIF